MFGSPLRLQMMEDIVVTLVDKVKSLEDEIEALKKAGES